MNFREPLRTLECAGLHPLIGQASQKGLRLEAAAHPSRGGAHGSPPRERVIHCSVASSSPFSRTLLEEWHSQLLPWLGEDREGSNAAQGNTAGSQHCPLQQLCPLIADVAVSFSLHSVPQVEQSLRKWITVDPGSLHKTNRVRTP